MHVDHPKLTPRVPMSQPRLQKNRRRKKRQVFFVLHPAGEQSLGFEGIGPIPLTWPWKNRQHTSQGRLHDHIGSECCFTERRLLRHATQTVLQYSVSTSPCNIDLYPRRNHKAQSVSCEPGVQLNRHGKNDMRSPTHLRANAPRVQQQPPRTTAHAHTTYAPAKPL